MTNRRNILTKIPATIVGISGLKTAYAKENHQGRTNDNGRGKNEPPGTGRDKNGMKTEIGEKLSNTGWNRKNKNIYYKEMAISDELLNKATEVPWMDIKNKHNSKVIKYNLNKLPKITRSDVEEWKNMRESLNTDPEKNIVSSE